MRFCSLFVASCVVASGCDHGPKSPTPPTTATVADIEKTIHGPELLSPDSYAWLPRCGDEGSETVVWKFDWSDEAEAIAYEFELIAVPSPRVAEKKIVTTEVKTSEYEHRWQEPMEAFSSGCAWRVRARVGDQWNEWSDRRLVYVDPSEETKQKVAQLAEVLQDKEKSSEERTAAAKELGDMHACARDAVRALVNVSDGMTNDPYVAHSAQNALESLGPAAKAAVPELARRLKDGHLSVKLPVVGVLRAIGPPASEALPQLLATMQQKTPSDYEGLPEKAAKSAWAMLRVACVSAVAAIGGREYYPQVVDVLIEFFEGKEGFAASAACGAMSQMQDLGPAGVPAIPYLIRGLKRRNSADKANAAIALGNIGPAATEAAPALEELVGDYYGGSPSAAEHAAEALTKITGVKHTVKR